MKNIISFIIIIGLVLVVVSSSLEKINSESNIIDHLNQILTPVKNILTNQSRISLISNENNYIKLYYQTQFVLVPNIIEKKMIENDTVLILEKRKAEKIDFPIHNYNIIYSNSGSKYNVILCTKKY